MDIQLPQNNLFAFDNIVINPQLRTPFEIIFGEKRVLQLPTKPKGNFVFSFTNGKVELHKVSKKRLKEIKDLSKLNETDEKGRKRYILSVRTGKPVLNSANARYRNLKYRKEKETIVTEEPEEQEQSRETFEDFVKNNYSKPKDIETKYFKTLTRGITEGDNIYEVINSTLQTELLINPSSFKCNISFSYVLKNKETNNRIIYYGRDNNTIFNTAIRIENRRDINDLINDLRNIGIVEYYQNSRPNSKWVFEALIDVVIKIFKTSIIAGSETTELPEWLVNCNNIYACKIRDNLCFFACLAVYNKIKQKEKRLDCYITEAVELYKSFYGNDNTSQYKGIDICDTDLMRNLEKHFEINILIFEGKQGEEVRTIRRSVESYNDYLYLHMSKDESLRIAHLSLIKNISTYKGKFECDKCGGILGSSKTLSKHRGKCQGKVKKFFKPQLYKPPQTLRGKLLSFGLLTNQEAENFGNHYYATYDFECLLKSVD